MSANIQRHFFVDRVARTHNNGFKKCGVTRVIEHLYFNQTFVLADSLSLQNPALLKPANR